MKKIDKNIKIVIGMVILAGILYGINMYLKKEKEIDYTTENYIELQGETIPTVYKLIGEKTISSVNSGVDTTGNYIEITYQDLSISELTDYFSEFRNQNYVLISSDKDGASIANEAEENGKIITITAIRSSDETKIKYSKSSGVLTRN